MLCLRALLRRATICALICALFSAAAFADDGDSREAFALEGYGEILYQHYNFGPDQKTGDEGSPPDERAIVDLPRLVFEAKYWFEEDLYLEAEFEVEHGGTGAAMELEYEEFGEFEQEVEKGGEIALEQFHITKQFSPEFGLRVGQVIVPIGLTNRHHRPGDFFGAVRPEAEESLIPVTWSETGLMLLGDVAGFHYRGGIVNGLTSAGFSSKFWVRDGHQGRFEFIRADNLAAFLMLEHEPLDGLMIGASGYHGNSSGNRPRDDMDGIDAKVSIGEIHAQFNAHNITARAMFLQGHLQNADQVSAKNSRLSAALETARTPVASEAQIMSAELGYNFLPLFNPDTDLSLQAFVRWEQFNSMHATDTPVFADPRFKRTVATFGLNFLPHRDIVVKSDYSIRTLGDERFNTEHTFSLAVGFSADLISR